MEERNLEERNETTPPAPWRDKKDRPATHEMSKKATKAIEWQKKKESLIGDTMPQRAKPAPETPMEAGIPITTKPPATKERVKEKAWNGEKDVRHGSMTSWQELLERGKEIKEKK